MPQATLILQLIQAVMAAAPYALDAVTRGKALVEALFTAKVITAAQQNALNSYVDSIALLWQSGIGPAHWQVEPDPATA